MKKKKKIKIIDYGAQELIKSGNILTRKVDGAKLRLVLSLEGNRLEHEHKSVLENYYARDLLCKENKELNNKRYWAGEKFEKIVNSAGIQQRVTASLKENLGGSGVEHFITSNIDAYSEFHFIIKEVGNDWHILWQVIVNNKPAAKKINNFRNALDKLILYFNF